MSYGRRSPHDAAPMPWLWPLDHARRRGNGGAWRRCLVCRVAADLRDWRYDPPANARYRTEAYRARRRAAYAARKARLWRAMKG